MLPDAQLRDVERMFVDLVADAIRHMKTFEANRKYSLSRLELIGEFTTYLRRYSKPLSDYGFPNFGDKCYWYHIAKPNFYWHFIYKGCDGVKRMDQFHANKLCEIASKRVESEEEEVDVKLFNLRGDIVGLDVFVSTARKLNSEAELILTNLCATAEKLQ